MQTRIISEKLYAASIGKGLLQIKTRMKWSIFSETISNVFNNYIPHETIICNNQDPPWINNKVKKGIQEKNQLFSRVKSNINNGTLVKKLQCLQNKLNDLIDTVKRQYYTRISMKHIGQF